MLRKTKIVVTLITLALLVPAQPAEARGIPSVARVRTMGGVSITASERAVIVEAVATTLDFYRRSDGWRCVTPIDRGGELPPLPQATGVDVDVLLIPNPDGSGDMLVIVEVQATGKRAASGGQSTGIPSEIVEGNNREGDLLHAVTQAMEATMNRLHPCTPKVKAKGKTKVSSQGLTWESEYEGEARLALTEDGSFSARMPLTYSWTPIVMVVPGVGSAVCTVTGANTDTADLEGHFDDSDGSLKFTRMQTQGLSGSLTSTCVVAGESATISLQVPASGGGDAAAQVDLRVALLDGAQQTIASPASGDGITWELTLDLGYDDEQSPAMARLPAVVPGSTTSAEDFPLP